MRARGTLWIALCGLTLCVSGRIACASVARSVTDIAGNRHTVPVSDTRATVLLFIGHECPISNEYSPEVNRIYADYRKRGVDFFVVYPDSDITPALAAHHAKAYGYACPVLMDKKHVLVKQTGVTITPEVAVLSATGTVLYRGRIDDRYVTYGTKRAQPTQHDLRSALDAVLAGKPVAVSRTKAIGCYVY